MRRRETPCEPESYTVGTPKTLKREFSDGEKAAEMHRLQSLVGSLIWLSCRTRPDLAYGVSMAASVITKDLEECHLRTRHLVQDLATHLSEGLFCRYGEEGEQIDIYGDASFAPGGSASRTGWILCLGSHALTWGSQRQTLIALSTCEAELIAATSAILAAQPMLLLLEEVRRQVRATLRCDNAAAIAIVKKEEVSLRNRHLSIRAEYLWDLPENVSISYTSTGEQKADVLTKGLARGLHQKAIRDIGMRDSEIERKELALALATTTQNYHASSVSSLDLDQLGVQRSSQIEDATRQCCDPFPFIVPTNSVEDSFGRGSGQAVLSDKLFSESSSGRTSERTVLSDKFFLESSREGTFERTVLSDKLFLESSLGGTFGKTVLSDQLSSGFVSEQALALHADTSEDYNVMTIAIVSAQIPTRCGHSPVTHTRNRMVSPSC